MMKKIKEILKLAHGDVLAIGLSEEEEEFLSNNKNITDIATLHNKAMISKKVKTKIKSKEKTVSIKKLRKKFRKNRIDTTVCNLNEVEMYLKYIIKDMIYFTKDNIYLYFDENDELKEKVEERFKRYNVDIKIEKKENLIFFKIDIHDKKKNKVKDIIYFIKDTIDNGIEFIRAFITY